MAELKVLPLSSIRLYKENVRATYDSTTDKELQSSMESIGLLSPILVRPVESPNGITHEVVAGARRFRAASALGWKEIAVQIYDGPEQDITEVQLTENIQRDDLAPLEMAKVIQKLWKKYNRDVQSLAEYLGKSISYVYAYNRLNDLIPQLKKKLATDELALSSALLIARLTEEQQKRIEKQIGADGSVAFVKRWIFENMTMMLKNVPWDLKESNIGGQGACHVCPKRSGGESQLFKDVTTEDRCLDNSCFRIKTKVFLESRIASILKETGKKPLLLSDNYWSHHPDFKDVLNTSQYRVKNCANSVPAIYVEIENKDRKLLGASVMVCVNDKCPECFPKDKRSPQATKASEEAKATREDAKVRNALATAIWEKPTPVKKVQEEIGNALEVLLEAFIKKLSWDEIRRTGHAIGVDMKPKSKDDLGVRDRAVKAIAKKAKEEPVKMALFLGYTGEALSTYSSKKPLVEFAEAAGVDVKEVTKIALTPKKKEKKQKANRR